jgi:hypothetical protein
VNTGTVLEARGIEFVYLTTSGSEFLHGD